MTTSIVTGWILCDELMRDVNAFAGVSGHPGGECLPE